MLGWGTPQGTGLFPHRQCQHRGCIIPSPANSPHTVGASTVASQAGNASFCYRLLKCGHSRGNGPPFGRCWHLLWCCCFSRQNWAAGRCAGERMDPPEQVGCLGRRAATLGWGFRWKAPPAPLPPQETQDKPLLLPMAAEKQQLPSG